MQSEQLVEVQRQAIPRAGSRRRHAEPGINLLTAGLWAVSWGRLLGEGL